MNVLARMLTVLALSTVVAGSTLAGPALADTVLADPVPASGQPPGAPDSIAALGDSITRGFNACGFYVDCPTHSFSTGTGVLSQYRRIAAVHPAITGQASNDAVSGASSAGLAGQAAAAVSQRAAYVTILIGANDVCTSSESTMTPVSTFRANIDAALATLQAGDPAADLLVISIPDIERLWAIGKGDLLARTAWSLLNICPAMLARPTSSAPDDAARRTRVRQRVIDDNAQLALACANYGPTCTFDNNALFNYPFTLDQVSGWDYFHPNTAGQQVLASITYAAGFAWPAGTGKNGP